jgi:iron complex transport system substrate-binding protein
MKSPLRRAVLAGAAAVACAAALAGCGALETSTTSTPATSSATPAAVTYPMTVKAGNGSVTIKAQPTRIISLSATATEDLYAVGAGSEVVAVDSDSDYPPTAPRTSLSGLTPNIEAIAKYNPSLVVAQEDSGGLVAGLAKLGVPVLIEPAATDLGAAYSQIEQLGAATGHLSQAATVVSGMQKSIAATVEKAGKALTDTYYWEVSANPYYSATSKTLFGELVGLFGLRNIADNADKPADGGYPQLTEEYIVTANPQVIFLTDNQASDGGQTPATVEARAGWSTVSAVTNKAVFGLNDDIAARWGPRLPELVQEIAQAVAQASSPQPTQTAAG